jgi:hypothetical protein
MKKVALKIKDIKTEQLVLQARNIHDCMASNASIFDAPPISMPTFRTQINELESAQINTYDRAKSATIIRNQKRAIIKASLVTLSWYVNSVSNGDEAIMNLAGMVAAARGPYRYPTKQSSLKPQKDMRQL